MGRILAALAVAWGLVACDSSGATHGSSGNLGVAGASCASSPECAPPLQCIQNVCTVLSSADVDAGGGDAASEADTARDYIPDVVPEIVTAYDASDWEFVADTGPEPSDGVSVGDTSPFEDCGALGIASSWTGTFIGAIDYHMNPNPLVPEQGTLPVTGDLAFDIRCIESKFVVNGTLDGVATVVGQGDFPFTLRLTGYYDPASQRLTAQMVDGMVSIYGLIEVYFAGTFVGMVGSDGGFSGTWEGASTGTNQQYITGTATGEGLWGAASAP